VPPTSLLVYQGRAGDRNPRGTAGARALGNALSRRLDLTPVVVGTVKEPLASTLWDEQVPGGLTLEQLHACALELARRRVVGIEIAEFESHWPDGRPGDPDILLDAIAPLLTQVSQGESKSV